MQTVLISSVVLSRQSPLTGVLILSACLLTCPPWANADPVSSGFALEQVDFDYFEGVSQPNSTWGNFIVTPSLLAAATGISKGYVNMHVEGLGWAVQNLYIDSNDGLGPIKTSFDLGLTSPADVSSLNISVDYSAEPEPDSVAGAFIPDVPVGDTLWNAQGVSELTVTAIGAPLSAGAITFPLLGASTVVGPPPAAPNVQTAVNQCFPMAIANSLQFLENDNAGFTVPHDHVVGLKGDNSLVGRLDSLSGRPVTDRRRGQGVGIEPMLEGKFKYLKDNKLATKIVQRHQGRGYGPPENRIPRGDFTAMGITSDHRGRPTFDFIANQVAKGENVEIVFSYDNFVGIPGGGHAVRVIEAGRTKDRPWIAFVHDARQSDDERGLEVRREWVLDTDRDGLLNVGGQNREIRFVLSESVRTDPPPKPNTQTQVNPGDSGGSVVSYDASTETLSFSPHPMVDTGFPGDPILEADVSLPDFTLGTMLASGEFIFESAAAAQLIIADGATVYLTALIPLLTYVPLDNLFYGELINFQFLDLSSPWIAEMASLFDPASPRFDPLRKLFFTYRPLAPLGSLTQGFTLSNSTTGTDSIFGAGRTIPEPAVLNLLGSGLVLLLGRSLGTAPPSERRGRRLRGKDERVRL